MSYYNDGSYFKMSENVKEKGSYDFSKDNVPNGIEMIDDNGNKIERLKKYGECRILKIADIVIAKDLAKSYRTGTKRYLCTKVKHTFMPYIPELRVGTFALKIEKDKHGTKCYWKYLKQEDEE